MGKSCGSEGNGPITKQPHTPKLKDPDIESKMGPRVPANLLGKKGFKDPSTVAGQRGSRNLARLMGVLTDATLI